MSFPFRRRTSSPVKAEYTNGHGGGAQKSYLMKSITNRKGEVDVRKAVQLLGVGVGVLTFLYLVTSVLRRGDKYRDPFRVNRGPGMNLFADFEGDMECKLNSQEIYLPVIPDQQKEKMDWPYCSVREKQGVAMSGGGRAGFDMPYIPNGCHYKWYSPLEICMILERFDAVVFIGDDLVQGIYGAFNMLLRRNLAFGALEQWKMTDRQISDCRCRKQFSNPECLKYMVKTSEETHKHDGESSQKSPLVCNRIPHYYFPIRGGAGTDMTNKFRDILDADPHSWKPIGIVHSLGLSTGFDWQRATESMDEWLTVADGSGRNTPFLWLGPNAAGHLKTPSKIMQEGNNALWHYSLMMANEAKRRGVESLNSYNLTLQASSWDGSNYDERVALVQAMMVANWLAKVETT